MLELLAMKPLSYLPPLHLEIAEGLYERGLVARKGDTWLPTDVGLLHIGRVPGGTPDVSLPAYAGVATGHANNRDGRPNPVYA